MNKLICLVILGCISMSMAMVKFGQATDSEIFAQFQTYMEEHKKKYTTVEEFKTRFEIFKTNYKQIEMHQHMLTRNAEADTYELGITEFFDMTPQEFARTHLNLDISHMQAIKAKASAIAPHYKNGNAPESWNWVEKGVVSKVKNQGMCGSCWAFSAIGNIEAVYAIKTGKNVEFSEQQLVDCDKVDQGCNGGLMEDAFKYSETGGVMAESDYKYTGRGGECKADASKAVAKVTGFHYAGSEDETVIKQALYENGPFAVALNASLLQFYFGGIFNPWWSWVCNPKSLNHGVLLVGYGVQGNKPYWIVKNSWGSGWGEKGYFRLIAGKGACGINTYVITAEVDQA